MTEAELAEIKGRTDWPGLLYPTDGRNPHAGPPHPGLGFMVQRVLIDRVDLDALLAALEEGE